MYVFGILVSSLTSTNKWATNWTCLVSMECLVPGLGTFTNTCTSLAIGEKIFLYDVDFQYPVGLVPEIALGLDSGLTLTMMNSSLTELQLQIRCD